MHLSTETAFLHVFSLKWIIKHNYFSEKIEFPINSSININGAAYILNVQINMSINIQIINI